jgi:hypothetical protein
VRVATADDLAGIEWWNSITAEQRRYWLELAKSAAAKDAWEHYKSIREVAAELLP